MLTENRTVLDQIADYLYEHETITGKEFMKIFRELKGIEAPPEEESGKKTFFEQAQEARLNLAGQENVEQSAEGAAGQKNTGSYVDYRIDDTTEHGDK